MSSTPTTPGTPATPGTPGTPGIPGNTDPGAALHVILGAGPVGQTLAQQLLADGNRVRLVSRSGTGATTPELAGADIVRADATDLSALLAATQGATAIHNALSPPYATWTEQWPPLHRNAMEAATRHGAVLVLMDNLYSYGDTAGTPMTPDTPQQPNSPGGRVRAGMADELLAAHRSGRLRATIVRASDFIGPLVTGSSMGDRVVPRVLRGKRVQVLGATDVAHSVTFMPDIARTLAIVARDERAWGRVWHVPSPAAMSQRATIERLAAAAGTTAKVSSVSKPLLKLLGLFSADLRELQHILYQFTAPFVIDATATEETFGLRATPMDIVAAQTVAWYRTGALPAAIRTVTPDPGFTRRSH